MSYGSTEGLPSPGAEDCDEACHVLGVAIHEKVAKMFEHKTKLICMWIALLAICAPFVAPFMNSVSLEGDPPKGSPTYIADMKIRNNFVNAPNTELVLISCGDCTSVLGEFAINTTRKLSLVLGELNVSYPGIIKTWSLAVPSRDALQLPGFIPATVTDDPAASLLLSANKRTLAFQSQWETPPDSPTLTGMIEKIKVAVKELNEQGKNSGFTILGTGSLMMVKDAVDTMTHDSMIKEIIVMPIAILVLLYHVHSWRLCALTACNVLISAFVAMGALYPVGKLIKISTLGPGILAALCLALSVDYALFLLTRFKSEMSCGKTVEQSVLISMVNSGSVVMLSGCILALCLLCCMLFPCSDINSLALAALFSVIFTVASSLTFTPCMILRFPEFFSKGLPVSEDETGGTGMVNLESRRWFQLGTLLTSPPYTWAVPLVIMAFMVPGAFQVTHMKFSSDIDSVLPRGSNAEKAYQVMADSFQEGMTTPVQIHLGGLSSVKSDEFFEETCGIFHRLLDSTRGTAYQVNPRDINNVVTMPSLFATLLPDTCSPLICLRWSESPPECPFLPSAADLLAGVNDPLLDKLGSIYRHSWSRQVSPNNKTLLTTITPGFDQSGELALPWSNALRQMDIGHLEFDVYSLPMADRDTREADYGRMPLVLGLSLATMFILMSMFFGMAFIPVKLFVTIILPIVFVYGFQVMVLQYGILSFLPLQVFKPVTGICWATPITSMTILIGLAVDYEIFLFSRVVEFRMKGYDNQAAVVGALTATGPIITGAGCIMAIAFFGMMLSSVRMNLHIGFLLTSGVLLDTFVVRSLLVPPVLMVGDVLNYWPRKMPEPTQTIADLEDLFNGVNTIQKSLLNP